MFYGSGFCRISQLAIYKERDLSKVRVGDVFKTNEGGSVTVISYKNNAHITVKHNDEHEHRAVVEGKRLLLGTIKNPYHRSVCGVGYLGVGKYKTQKDKVLCEAYKVWRAMLKRCYTEQLTKNINYKDCTVSEEWHNFQNFAEWYYNNTSYGLGYELDKDLLLRDNKVYSANTCCMIPSFVNTVIRRNHNGDKIKGFSKRSESNYEVKITFMENRSKSFSSEKEALRYYSKTKSDYVRSMAVSLYRRLEKRAFINLLFWEF